MQARKNSSTAGVSQCPLCAKVIAHMFRHYERIVHTTPRPPHPVYKLEMAPISIPSTLPVHGRAMSAAQAIRNVDAAVRFVQATTARASVLHEAKMNPPSLKESLDN